MAVFDWKIQERKEKICAIIKASAPAAERNGVIKQV